MPSIGYVCHGYDRALSKIRISSLVTGTIHALGEAQETLTSKADVPLNLKKYCSLCEYKVRCQEIAIEADNLSLMGTVGEKERRRLHEKGITTVTQLSYTFRPRRRPKRLRDKRERYHHSLKALAIREKKIHIVGSPELKIEGTPV